MRTIEVLAVAAALLGIAGAVSAQDTYTPSATKVALLPAANVSEENDRKQRADQAKLVDKTLREEFGSRGFVLVEDAAIRKAIEDQRLDFGDEENHRRATVLGVGKAVGADVVVFVTVTGVGQKVDHGGGVDLKEGAVRLKAWVIDVRTEKAALSARVLTAKSRDPFLWPERGSTLMRHACVRAVRDGLKDYLKPYPVLKEQKGK